MTYTRELLGDLVVASVELADAPRTYEAAERWLRLAAQTAAAVRANPDDADAELLGALSASRAVAFELREAFAVAKTITWEGACVFRSGLEAIRELAVPELDLARFERWMESFDKTAVTAPAGTPSHEWWWFGATPAIQMNQPMRSLLPLQNHAGVLATDIASDEFRRLVAQGFVVEDGCLYYRAHAAREADGSADPTGAEATLNAIRVEDYLPRDPSRRPVDLAVLALACARHLACELRRRPERCRIIVSQTQLQATLRFHQQRATPWLAHRLEDYREAMLVLDS